MLRGQLPVPWSEYREGRMLEGTGVEAVYKATRLTGTACIVDRGQEPSVKF